MYHTLRVFRPHRTPPEQLERTFVGREPLLQEILDKLKKWQPGKSRQHYLIIGPRGIGKTNLLKLIEYRVEKNPKLKNKWYAISLSEDAYGITKVSDLLVEALRILSDKTNDKNLTSTYNKVQFDDNDERVTDLSLDAFRKFHMENGCGILLMVENVNRVLESQFKVKREIHLLRKILIEEEWLILISTSPTYLNAVTKPEEPLFEFFQVKLLEELSPDEQQEMLRKIALLEKNNDFIENYLNKLKPQLRALYHFTGGNPRLTIMLYDLIANQNIRDVRDELDSLLDKLTPFYQDRMKEIADQEAKLLEKMALMAEGSTPTELAKASRMEHKTVSALLTRLERTGYVRREPRRKKRTVYIIPERFFRIWHQMNHSHSARGRIQYLLEFFTSWYATPEERDQIWGKLAAQFQEVLKINKEERIDELSEYMQYIEGISEGEEKYKRLFDRLLKVYNLKGFGAVKGELKNLDMEYQNDDIYFLNKGIFLSNIFGEDDEEAMSAFIEENIKLNDITKLLNFGIFLHHMEEYQETWMLLMLILHGSFEDEYKKKFPDIFQFDKDWPISIFQNVDDRIIDKMVNIIKTSKSPYKIKIGLTILGFLRSEKRIPLILNFLDHDSESIRESAINALGYTASELAVEPLINFLKNESTDIRFKAAAALGRIGSELAVQTLIDCSKDENDVLRIISIIALGKAATKRPIPHLETVIQALLEIKEDVIIYLLIQAVRGLLGSAFRSGDVEMIEVSIEHVEKGFENGEEIFKPYIIALEYIKSNHDPAIIERQQPEMREAVQLLVDSFNTQ
jgi:DNA polymerase III delta prime subunit